jgi:outer membrane protein assembly factor BamA
LKNYQIAGWILIGLFLTFHLTYAAGYSQDEEGFGKSYLLLPVIVSQPNTGLAYGGVYLGNLFGTGMIFDHDGHSKFFINKRSYFDDGQFLLLTSASWENWSSTFYGIGNEDFESPGEDYTGKKAQFASGFLLRLQDGLYFGLTVAANRFSVSDKETGGQLAGGTIVGSDGADAVGIGLRLLSDQRDDHVFPTEGSLLDLKVLFYDPDYGSDQKFSQSTVIFNKFIPAAIGGVLVLQSRIVYSHGDIPFQMLPSLGDPEIMRGIRVNKDINRDLLAVSTEYRFSIYQRLTGATFLGIGDAANSFAELQMDKFIGGFGIRYYFTGPFKLFFNKGFSEHDSAAYFGMDASF